MWDLSFDLTNELVRKNIIQSIKDNIQAYTDTIIIDCFRKGELSTKKENAMIEEYRKTRTQVILSATLKDEEYTSGSKYYDMPGVNAIDYEMHQDSHILQNKHVDAFGELMRSFGVTFT